MSAAHMRSWTFIFGVKGDGIDKGVEQTRTRVGGSRESELQAMNATGDEDEKRRDLSSQGVQMLASLDRRATCKKPHDFCVARDGFFATLSHDRVVLLPPPSLLKPLTHTVYLARTLQRGKVRPLSLLFLRPGHQYAKESVWKKPGHMLLPRSRDAGGNVRTCTAEEHKLSRRAFKGIPYRRRSAAWLASISKFAHAGKDQLIALSIEYREALEMHSPCDIQIDLVCTADSMVTYYFGRVSVAGKPLGLNYGKSHTEQSGIEQRSLSHVLHDSSRRCRQCGCCQGMGPIAVIVMLLCYFAPEHAYTSLVHLHDAYHMHGIFSPEFPGLLESIYIQGCITEEMMPEAYAAFKRHIASTSSYATK